MEQLRARARRRSPTSRSIASRRRRAASRRRCSRRPRAPPEPRRRRCRRAAGQLVDEEPHLPAARAAPRPGRQRSSQTRDRLPAIEAELRQVEQAYEQSESDLERYDCYEYFLFSKSLRRTRRCVDLAQQREQTQRKVSELEAQRQQIVSSGEQSYRDDIVRELARNNCGANYTQEARRYDRGDDRSIWQDEGESSFSGRWTPFGGAHSGATYRTVCVRLCDGYYFPVSFSTLPSHFEQDAAACQSKCAAPIELYYYQNPGAAMDQSVAFRSQEPYTSLKTAFRYRKELVRGCSCKEAEYVAPDAPAGQGKRAETDATTGWEARSDAQAQGQQQ